MMEALHEFSIPTVVSNKDEGLNSDVDHGVDTCQLSTGAHCTYASIVFWFLAGSLMMTDQSSTTVAEGECQGGEDTNLEQLLLPEVV